MVLEEVQYLEYFHLYFCFSNKKWRHTCQIVVCGLKYLDFIILSCWKMVKLFDTHDNITGCIQDIIIKVSI